MIQQYFIHQSIRHSILLKADKDFKIHVCVQLRETGSAHELVDHIRRSEGERP